ncbi:IS5 family transposase [Reyranella aquatilis]|uniref:IS5 family transposase n=1 Tax=Reyranella aquatilis TaxID=2035356 RepID=A0ABS8L4C5_9HYPH|nr:IS5 family transposase [Reyranella aquatilis]MCC8432822.1 IS5 family transposase [Reyranella aquatilis]
MWTQEHRQSHDRKGLRYPSDLTDAEWALVGSLIPPARRGGRPRDVDIREVLNAVFYLLSTGCQWDALPRDLPPKSTVYEYFSLWRSDRTLLRLHQALYAQVREASGRKAQPTVAILDSQSAKAAQKGGPPIDPQGYDAGKKVTGRKRHILVDTLGLLLNVVVHRASVQDRDGTRRLLRDDARRFPSIIKIFADAGYQGPKMAKVVADTGNWQIEIVKRTELHKFVVMPKRWIVERTFAWISRNRRLARDFERYAATVVAFVRLAMIRIMLRRLTRLNPCS